MFPLILVYIINNLKVKIYLKISPLNRAVSITRILYSVPLKEYHESSLLTIIRIVNHNEANTLSCTLSQTYNIYDFLLLFFDVTLL